MHRTVASIFSGCGGFDLGFTRRGFHCIGGFDIDPTAVCSFNRNIAPHAVVHDLSKGLGFIPNGFKLDVLLAGSPCQGFSTAGKRRIDDPRNHLLLMSGNIALALKPKVFVVENVASVISGEHQYYWVTLQGMLRSAGYRTTDVVIQAHQMGMAQIRKRRVLLAWKSPRTFNISFGNFPSVNLRDILCGLEQQEQDVDALPVGSEHYRIALRIGQGQKLSNVRSSPAAIHTWDIPEVFGLITEQERVILEAILLLRRRHRRREFGDADPVALATLEAHFQRPFMPYLASLEEKGYIRRIGEDFDLVHTFNGKYRRLRWDSPSLTVDTRFSNPRYFLHPEEHRGFTIREAARIQGFPDDFVFSGSQSAQMRQIGNAVPPPVAYELANLIFGAVFC